MTSGQSIDAPPETAVRELYRQILETWNKRNARVMVELLATRVSAIALEEAGYVVLDPETQFNAQVVSNRALSKWE